MTIHIRKLLISFSGVAIHVTRTSKRLMIFSPLICWCRCVKIIHETTVCMMKLLPSIQKDQIMDLYIYMACSMSDNEESVCDDDH